jgi:hypothetical protein
MMTVVGLVLLALAACGYASESLDREPGDRWPPWPRGR